MHELVIRTREELVFGIPETDDFDPERVRSNMELNPVYKAYLRTDWHDSQEHGVLLPPCEDLLRCGSSSRWRARWKGGSRCTSRESSW